MLGKSELTSFVNLILPQIISDSFTNKTPFDEGFSERLKLKDDVVSTILDPMWHHTSVSNCFYYMITIALSLQIV